jgi:hypothetical protein
MNFFKFLYLVSMLLLHDLVNAQSESSVEIGNNIFYISSENTYPGTQFIPMVALRRHPVNKGWYKFQSCYATSPTQFAEVENQLPCNDIGSTTIDNKNYPVYYNQEGIQSLFDSLAYYSLEHDVFSGIYNIIALPFLASKFLTVGKGVLALTQRVAYDYAFFSFFEYTGDSIPRNLNKEIEGPFTVVKLDKAKINTLAEEIHKILMNNSKAKFEVTKSQMWNCYGTTSDLCVNIKVKPLESNTYAPYHP